MRYLALRSRTVAVVGLWVLAGALLVTAATPSGAQADCPSGYVALTFDDGPHGQHTLEVLDVLAAKSATGVFFVIGRSAAAYPDLLGRMAAEGHQVLNHTWSHANLTIFSAAQIVGEIQHTADSIAAAESIIRRALPNPEALADGAVLLLHDGLPRTSPTGHPTVAALPAIIERTSRARVLLRTPCSRRRRRRIRRVPGAGSGGRPGGGSRAPGSDTRRPRAASGSRDPACAFRPDTGGPRSGRPGKSCAGRGDRWSRDGDRGWSGGGGRNRPRAAGDGAAKLRAVLPARPGACW